MTLLDLRPGSRAVGLSADHHEPLDVTVAMGDGLYHLDEVLEWKPGAVRVRVSDPVGRPIDARVAFSGPSALPSGSVGPDGVEVFDPFTNTWSPRAPLLGPRASHASALLPDGTLLLFGGQGATGTLANVEALRF